jgi:hypothetical protein
MSSKFGKYGWINRNNPEAAGVCDRGGEIRKRSELMAEMMYAGNRLVPNGFLCCRFHIDKPNPQSRPYDLRPDPVPVVNPRPDLDAATLRPTAGLPIASTSRLVSSSNDWASE